MVAVQGLSRVDTSRMAPVACSTESLGTSQAFISGCHVQEPAICPKLLKIRAETVRHQSMNCVNDILIPKS